MPVRLVRVICSRRRFVRSVLLSASAFVSVGCGTILYPERRGQPAGRLDWGVVALDGIGLILFFIPGVIAFAVDFTTGAIYLPYDGYGSAEPPPSGLRRVDVPRRQLTPGGVAQAVSAATGRSIVLKRNTFTTRPLENLDCFWNARNELAAANDQLPARSILRSQSPLK